MSFFLFWDFKPWAIIYFYCFSCHGNYQLFFFSQQLKPRLWKGVGLRVRFWPLWRCAKCFWCSFLLNCNSVYCVWFRGGLFFSVVRCLRVFKHRRALGYVWFYSWADSGVYLCLTSRHFIVKIKSTKALWGPCANPPRRRKSLWVRGTKS